MSLNEHTPADFVVLGHIARAHGVHGAVVVAAYTEDPERVLSAERLELLSPDGKKRLPATGLKGKPAAQGLIIKFAGVDSREAAMALKGWRLGLERRYLPETDDDEVYLADLIGLDVFTVKGLLVGRVDNLIEAGSGLILVVRPIQSPDKEVLLPFHEEFLVTLDVAAGRLVLDPPEGLLDL